LTKSVTLVMEYDAACAHAWHGKPEKSRVYIGDQANETLLGEVVSDWTKDKLDVIIDDGGHTMEQQQASFAALWEIVAPGGFYVIEDLTTYSSHYGGHELPGIAGTTIEWIKALLDGLQCQEESMPFCETASLQTGLLSIECFPGVCAFNKAH